MQINQEKIEQSIIAQAVDEIVSERDIRDRVKAEVSARIDKIFKDTVEAQIAEVVTATVKTGFERSYCKVDSFGHPVGEPTTIARELEKQVSGYWNQTVDNEGKPTTDNYRSKGTRAEWLMTKLVAADFQGEMKQHVVNLGGTLKDKLRAELHETVNKLLSEVIHVRSYEDQHGRRMDRSCIDPEEGAASFPSK